MPHAVFDEASLRRQATFQRVEMHQDLVQVGLEAAKRTSVFIDETDIDNLEKQSGHRLSINDFEKRVQKLCPQVVFRTQYLAPDQAALLQLNPGSTKRNMLQIRPDGEPFFLAGFQNQAILPEYTVVLTRKKRIPAKIDSHKYIKAGDGSWAKIPHVPGKDIPKATQTANGTFKFEGVGPGETYIKDVAGTLVGWRSLLARLVLYGLATPEQVEREFGSSDRASWAVRMGRRHIDMPL